jgi:hypothetical protein
LSNNLPDNRCNTVPPPRAATTGESTWAYSVSSRKPGEKLWGGKGAEAAQNSPAAMDELNAKAAKTTETTETCIASHRKTWA